MLRLAIYCMVIGSLSLLGGCGNTPTAPTERTFQTTISDPDRIRFSGKGAGAGVMLMSSIGPAGIAIGVAIDEGISKDIQRAFLQTGVNMPELVGRALNSEAGADQRYALGKDSSGDADLVVAIERYGFKTVPGDGDLVTPEIIGSIRAKDSEHYSFKYPDDFSDNTLVAELGEVKTDGAATSKLLFEAFERVLSHYHASAGRQKAYE